MVYAVLVRELTLFASCLVAVEVATVVGVAEVTIKNAYKDLYERRAEIVPKDFGLTKGYESLPEP